MPVAESPAARPHDKRLLLFVIASLLTANVLQWAICRALHLGNPGSIKPLLTDFAHLRQWTDSWLPMMKSLDYFQSNPTQPIYAAKLYDTLIYPLGSLLPLWLLRKLGVSDPTMLRLLAIGSWLAVLGIAAVSIAMARMLLRTRAATLTWPSILAILLAVFGCYPLLKGNALGNAQTFLSFGFCLLLYLWTTHRERPAGALAALLAFVKPQFAVLLLWFAIRRRWGATVAFLACSALVLAASIAVFGWHNNLDYLAVLAGLSHKAQTHYGNQSMFGTLNRLIFNGENLTYTPNVYTPYIPWVYRTTVATSLILVAGVLAFPWGKLRASTADMAAMGLASVAASPMAWEHHYGIIIGIFTWTWFAYACRQQRPPWLLALAFFLTMNFLAATNLLAARPGWNLLQSYMYFGALLLLYVLARLARNITHGLEQAP